MIPLWLQRPQLIYHALTRDFARPKPTDAILEVGGHFRRFRSRYLGVWRRQRDQLGAAIRFGKRLGRWRQQLEGFFRRERRRQLEHGLRRNASPAQRLLAKRALHRDDRG